MVPLVDRGPQLWAAPESELIAQLGVTGGGLTGEEAARRRSVVGPNRIDGPRGHRGLRLLVAQFTSPIILILAGATVLSMALGDTVDGLIILAIIAASGGLGFWQEHRAGRAIDALQAGVQVDVEVRRDGRDLSVPIDTIVPGDLVVLTGGDIVPGDARVLTAHDLLVDEATLTGESFPVEKDVGVVAADAALTERRNTVFMGTHVVSGTAEVLVAHTGPDTVFGALSARLRDDDVTTGFERGVTQFGFLLMRVVALLVVAIFVINVVLDRPLVDSLLFSLALAVGLTPQLLPAIVSISLSVGAQRMAREKVVVRRLDAIEDFGAMTVLCTDKTGTLTAGAVRLDRAVDPAGTPSTDVLRLAALNAGLQRGYSNPIDDAILAVTGRPPDAVALDEVPYDFTRKRLGVLVDDGVAGPLLVVKGAYSAVASVCATVRTARGEAAMAESADGLDALFASLSGDGYRVLALATKPLPAAASATAADERDMELRGLLAFHDAPKEGVADAIGRLADQGVSVRLVTGDNHLAARHVAEAVGLDAGRTLTGAAIDGMDDDALMAECVATTVFAEVEPLHKQRIVEALRRAGETVGFLGDGINDTNAIHAADVGISVDTAVDAARQTAAIVLLDKSLAVVSDGVALGRRTFANTLKYIRVTTSANFGNMLSMAVAATFLPFLPLLPRQILLLNFVSDIPGMAIAGDEVDAEQLRAPRAWHLRSIRNFMLTYGLLSAVFDIATFLVLRLGFDAGATLFRSAWFVESTLTELVVMLVLRTNRLAVRSRPGRGLLVSSVVVAAFTILLPYSPLAAPLGLDGLPTPVLGAVGGLVVVYVIANELVKRWMPPAV